MAFISSKSNIKNSILAFVKNIVSKKVYKDIEVLLNPCCKTTVIFDTFSCGFTGDVFGIIFNNVTITDVTFAGRTVELFLTSVDYPTGGVIKTITLDASGHWNGNLQSSFDGGSRPNPFTMSVVVTLLPLDLDVVHRSIAHVLTVPNCD